jgi:hypothetical protein
VIRLVFGRLLQRPYQPETHLPRICKPPLALWDLRIAPVPGSIRLETVGAAQFNRSFRKSATPSDFGYLLHWQQLPDRIWPSKQKYLHTPGNGPVSIPSHCLTYHTVPMHWEVFVLLYETCRRCSFHTTHTVELRIVSAEKISGCGACAARILPFSFCWQPVEEPVFLVQPAAIHQRAILRHAICRVTTLFSHAPAKIDILRTGPGDRIHIGILARIFIFQKHIKFIAGNFISAHPESGELDRLLRTFVCIAVFFCWRATDQKAAPERIGTILKRNELPGIDLVERAERS